MICRSCLIYRRVVEEARGDVERRYPEFMQRYGARHSVGKRGESTEMWKGKLQSHLSYLEGLADTTCPEGACVLVEGVIKGKTDGI